MDRMVRCSLVRPYKYSTYTFLPGAGYHIPNGCTSAITGRLLNLIHDPSLISAVYPPRKSCYDIQRENNARKYVHGLVKRSGDVERRDHSPYNMTDDQVQRLDHFLLFVTIFLESRWYQEMTMTVKGGGNKRARFNRLPFQQMMLLDILMTMIDRSGLSEHRVTILMHLKTRLGLDWLTFMKAPIVAARFATKSSGYVVPRRCGKSSFAGTIMALSMAACPFAGIKGLYTAHDRRLVNETFTRVGENLDRIMTEFNAYQLFEFHARKRANNVEVVPGDYYFRAEGEKRIQTGIIRVKFLLMDDRGQRHLSGDPDLVNTLMCRVYAKENTFRGATFNLMYVDETNFLPPSIYDELLPMISTGGGRMILMSSQKCGQNRKAFIDLSSIRMKGMLMNVVGYMCRRHVISAIRSTHVSITRCMCSFFRSPLHIVTDKPFRRMMTLFSTKTGGNQSEEDAENSKSAMLSEVGGIPPGMKREDLYSLDLNGMQLANQVGDRHMTVQSIPVEDYVVTGELKGLDFVTDVTVYIDPAPTDRTRSYAAMSFATRAIEFHSESSQSRAHYVILAVEEFRPQWVDRDKKDELYALAVVFMNTVRALSMLYCGFFKRFIVVPEANSISIERFWAYCGSLLNDEGFEFIQEFGITILCSVIEYPPQKMTHTERYQMRKRRDELKRKRKIADRFNPYNSFAARLQRCGRSHLKFETVTDGHQCIETLDNALFTTELEELSRAEMDSNEEAALGDQPGHFRLGYTLGSDKVTRFWDFFASCYNKSDRNLSDVTCARLIYSYMLSLQGRSIPAHIVDALSVLTIRRKKGSVNSYFVSGKSTPKDSFMRDDLATAVVCSVTLCADILDGEFGGRFVRLE